MLKTYILLLLVFAAGLYTQENKNHILNTALIDSLTEVIKLNEKTRMIRFGSDAVSAINTKEGIIIVDAGISAELTAGYRKKIKTQFNNKEFLYVINTHGHHDHYRGNYIFKDSKIIAHLNSLKEINFYLAYPEKLKEALKNTVSTTESYLKSLEPKTDEWKEILTQVIKYKSAYNDINNNIPVLKPDLTFNDSLKIPLTDMNLDIFYFGNFHSESDIIIYIPEMKMIFTGDLFSKYGRPSRDYSLMTDSKIISQSLNKIEKRLNNIETVVTGHGVILTQQDLKSFISLVKKELNRI